MNTTNHTTNGLHLADITLDVADGRDTRRLLNGISLDVAAGEIVGLTGPSGSGKSTLLAVAGCLQRPDAGAATLNIGGEVIDLAAAKANQAAAIRRDHIGIVFQQANLLPALKVREQLEVMSRLGRVLPPSAKKRRTTRQRAMDLLAAVGVADLAERKTGELSGGQQARVNLARALMNDPALILADEPTAALDRRSAEAVTELLGTVVHDLGAAALYVTHDHSQLTIADRVLEMVDGQIGEPVAPR
ncbi:ABC transporter ATP-binding protein [Corynebacterium sp. TAE3-ERU12]|uniref:ABC transporter ATP-binding protein n=1 Tax=Corynebacterium sp. TAE3-ERU12 TaxID=2849491 RepID=UPI001C46B903|nr:ABC transporter ATP-binding protein [Corynebacterium sp. TAE3-ERU12]MBV7294894.1 ABC transporter ATP-binding protein [Corynebacterium sp. TAE3-ERU12]